MSCCISCDYGTIYISFVFFFNDTATTEIYTLSLHDALPISPLAARAMPGGGQVQRRVRPGHSPAFRVRSDRKSTRLNSSHANISYAVFCLKKKKNKSRIHSQHLLDLRLTTHLPNSYDHVSCR